MIDIKEAVKHNCYFEKYRKGYLYFKAGSISFPVPIDDLGDATVDYQVKGIYLMRYMRKYNESLKEDKQ
jgi:hypothetical protein